ncbi:MAG: ArnT family glycosyltransferase [Thermoanaerobaculia bacterium]
MERFGFEKSRDGMMALVGAMLFAYVAIRATRVPITHDEALTYFSFVTHSFRTIVSVPSSWSANNHVLNSLLARLALLAFGPSEWALRLPNVLAFCLYLACGMALCRRYSSAVSSACAFLLLTANPFLLEFFSLSRGYGLGLAFLSAALLQFIRAEEKPPSARRELFVGGLCAFLAVLANLAFLLPVLALLIVSAARNWNDVRRWGPSLAVAPLLVAAVLGPRIVALQRAGQFYAGGSNGFLTDTAGSLVRMTLGGSEGGAFAIPVLGGVAASLLALGLVGAVVPSGAGGRRIARVVGSVLVLAAAGSAVQHAFVGTPYLEDRTAIFFLPLLALSAGGGLDALGAASWRAVRTAGRGFAVVLTIIAALPLIRSANFDHTTIWQYDADVRRVVDDLTALHQEGLERIRLGGNWVFGPALNFYRETRRLAWLEPIIHNDPLDRCNVVLTSGYEHIPIPRGEFSERRGYPLSGNILLVRIRPAGSGEPALEDTCLTGSIDTPVGGETVAGDLKVRGWARVPGEDLRVTVRLDAVARENARVSRVSRPDVAAAIPSLGDCSGAGYEAAIPFRSGDEGRHMIEVVFTSVDGRERHYPVRSFVWKRN